MLQCAETEAGMGAFKDMWVRGEDPDDWILKGSAYERFETEADVEYFKETGVDDWLVGSDQAKAKNIRLESFLRWLLNEHPEDDEIFNFLQENFLDEGCKVVSSSDIEDVLPPGYWDRLRDLLVEFSKVKVASETVSMDEPKAYLKTVKRLPDGAVTEREWNFREDNNQHFYGDIPYNQEIITLTLNWKPDSYSPSKLVGKYQIDLPLLLEKGFVQDGLKGIKLRFQSTGNAIEIAIDRNSPALRIGSKPQ
jgi:hypothetical protein